MVTPEMLSYIKQQISSGKTPEEIKALLISQGGWETSDVDEAIHVINKESLPPGSKDAVEEAIKTYTRYLKTDILIIILLVLSAVVGGILFMVNPILGVIGAAILGTLILSVLLIIFTVVLLIGLVRGLIINHRIKREVASHILASQYKKKYYALLIFNCIMLCIIVFVTVPFLIQKYTPVGRNAETISQKERDAADRARYVEDEKNHVINLMKGFKQIAEEAKDMFPKLSEVPNNGNCENPAPHSFFNPDTSLFIDNSYPNSTEKIYSGTGSELAKYLSYFTFQKLGHCYSDAEHFAFDMPNYLENPYINFYCIDDIHPDIQINKKPIKGPSCDDLDMSYIPVTRPVDTPITY